MYVTNIKPGNLVEETGYSEQKRREGRLGRSDLDNSKQSAKKVYY